MHAQDQVHPKAKKISKAVFQAMVEVAHDGIFVYQDHRFFYVNPAFERMLGYSAEELEEMSYAGVMHADAARLMHQRDHAFAKGEDVRPRRLDVVFKTKTGHERIVSMSTSTISLSGEKATVNIAHDITRRKGMEQSLESTNKFLAGLIASSSDAIVASDLKGKALIFNKAAEDITGFGAEDMLNHKANIVQFMVPGERDRIMAVLDQGTEENPRWVVSEETRIYSKEGITIPISLSVSYLYSEGRPVAAISVFRDLRPMKKVEDRLRESEQKYRMLVEKTADGIFVYQDHKFKYTNPAFRELLGYTEDEVGRMGLGDIVRPELSRMIEARYDKRIRGERVPEQYEIALRSSDDLWRAFEITPSVIEYEGRPATQNVIRDITEKREAQKALRASEAKYRATVEHTGTAMMILDEDYRVTFANNQMEKLSGYTKDEIIGKMRWTQVVHPDDVERMKAYSRARRQGALDVPSQYEFRFMDKYARIHDSFLTIGMIPGTMQSIVSIMDITEIKQMQRELEQARKMAILGEMSAHVAHEVRNPLQKIKTGVELLSNSLILDGRQRRQLDGVKNGVDNLEKFVTQILDWTRSGELRPKAHRISNIIDGLLFNLTDTFEQRGVRVETDYDPEADTVVVDGIQLRQVFENIIENAQDAMPDGGTLAISTCVVARHEFSRGREEAFCADAVEIRIRDTGSGIAADEREKIFQPFYTRKAKGTGLGLALVRKVIDMHHGEVEAATGIEQGAEFVIRLPREQCGPVRATNVHGSKDLKKG
ncbi:MAG TPA: PAS domain S-box protein [Deltaproteobacteria bacterium]|nr:PAS domain S-box protein [Deltaproteobacteria bacterium]HPR54348.1 PAS domain S-box protein [Deltaproteobacteria bacterium]HXK47013.1 PAS domain S-box protein [Deltaproteobacteria bacterium]